MPVKEFSIIVSLLLFDRAPIISALVLSQLRHHKNFHVLAHGNCDLRSWFKKRSNKIDPKIRRFTVLTRAQFLSLAIGLHSTNYFLILRTTRISFSFPDYFFFSNSMAKFWFFVSPNSDFLIFLEIIKNPSTIGQFVKFPYCRLHFAREL